MRSPVIAILLSLASSAAAQPAAPYATWFNWVDPHIAILPDSSGTYFWVQSGAAGDPGPKRTLAVTFDPAKIDAGMAGARAFFLRAIHRIGRGGTKTVS